MFTDSAMNSNCFLQCRLTNCIYFFSRFMNQYFLLIACLQLWSLITPVNPASTWGPLIFIFAVSATKEAWDDYHRYLSDKKANEKEVWVVKQGTKKHVVEPIYSPLSHGLDIYRLWTALTSEKLTSYVYWRCLLVGSSSGCSSR